MRRIDFAGRGNLLEADAIARREAMRVTEFDTDILRIALGSMT